MKVEKFNRNRGKRWRLLIGVGLLIGTTYLLGWSNVFSVKEIVVVGAPSLAESVLIQNSVHVGDKLARLETKSLSKTLSAFPWLERSLIGRNWFSGMVTIHVWTRTPIAITNGKLIDRFGRTFELPGDRGVGLPTINAPTQAGQLLAVKVLVQLPQKLRSSLRIITASGAHSVRLLVQEKSLGIPRAISIIWGDLSYSDLKGRVYSALIALPENMNVSLVDVSAPHAPIVK